MIVSTTDTMGRVLRNRLTTLAFQHIKLSDAMCTYPALCNDLREPVYPLRKPPESSDSKVVTASNCFKTSDFYIQW
jgi:hypothetical protein